MNGIRNENQLRIVKVYEIFELHVHKTVSIIDDCYGDCHNKHFLPFKCRCIN